MRSGNYQHTFFIHVSNKVLCSHHSDLFARQIFPMKQKCSALFTFNIGPDNNIFRLRVTQVRETEKKELNYNPQY